jgi:hypothetical protein
MSDEGRRADRHGSGYGLRATVVGQRAISGPNRAEPENHGRGQGGRAPDSGHSAVAHAYTEHTLPNVAEMLISRPLAIVAYTSAPSRVCKRDSSDRFSSARCWQCHTDALVDSAFSWHARNDRASTDLGRCRLGFHSKDSTHHCSWGCRQGDEFLIRLAEAQEKPAPLNGARESTSTVCPEIDRPSSSRLCLRRSPVAARLAGASADNSIRALETTPDKSPHSRGVVATVRLGRGEG